MIIAIHNNVVLKKKIQNEHNGIYMPNAKDESFVVLNVGELVKNIKVNDEVILNLNPKSFMLDGKTYYITSVENIIAKVEDQNE